MVGADSACQDISGVGKNSVAADESYVTVVWQSLMEVKSACEEIKFVRERIVQSIDEATESFVHIVTILEAQDSKESQL